VERWIGWANDDIGTRPLPEVEAGDVLAVIKRVSDRGNPASAEFCRQTISRVFNYGIRTLRAPRGFNPAEAAVKGAIIVPEKRHRPKLGANQLPAFLADLDKYQGPGAVKIGIKILLHCFLKKPLDTGRLLQVVALFTPNPA
jgi:integrase